MLNKFNTSVIVNLDFEAIHSWSGVLEHKSLEEVQFLQHKHRHMLRIKCYKRVDHLDRDVEIILLKRKVLEFLANKYPGGDIGEQSCEMLAVELCSVFDLCACEVLEDGENGALVEVSL